MKIPEHATVDCETEGIEGRPNYPPVPVGVAIKKPGEKKGKYYAWGHPTNNNCTKEMAQRALDEVWRAPYDLLFQNAKFDYDVITQHLNMPALPWTRMQDTLYLLFLNNPYARSLNLKLSGESILGIKPKERDIVKEWVLANVPEAKRKPSEWGEYICRAPGDMVGNYALDGDVGTTDKLFKYLYPSICERGMLGAYNRERNLMPIMLENEQIGIKVNLRAMERDYVQYVKAVEIADTWLRRRLGNETLEFSKKQQVADALEASGVVTDWVYTKPTKAHPGGIRSVAKKNLTKNMFNDPQVAAVFDYRNRLTTCLSMFFVPWLTVARQTDGVIYTTWNQVRQAKGDGGEDLMGARTGRFSSHPNFQNVPKNWKKAVAEGYIYPAFLGVPPLPIMRSYFLPDEKDHLWGRRDYNQQELRLLAHFEDGDLQQRYIDNPRTDIHDEVQVFIREVVGLDLPRDPVKILNFGDIYGRGLAALSVALGVDQETCKRLRRAKDQLLPGIPALNEALKQRAAEGLPIRTWGGREYFCEESKYVESLGRTIDFDYKLLNYLVQGTAADVTKESIIRYHEHPKREGRLLITVHDENNISAHKKVFKREMAIMRECMQSVELDVPMLSDGEFGANWGNMAKFVEPVLDTRTTIGDYKG